MARRRRKRFRMQPRFFLVLVTILGVVIIALLLIKKVSSDSEEALEATPVPTATLAPTATPDPALPDDVTVTRSDSANPNSFGMEGTISAEGNDTTSYSRENKISFGRNIEYSELPGILTFGGNNYRDTFAYGTVSISEKRIRQQWSKTIGTLGSWSGTGWTGQPLIVQWPAETVAVMNVKDSYKTGEPLTEVIYPAMDGSIYFLDLESGSATRDPIVTGVVQKGTSCIDPRGYPLLFVGQGIPVENDQGNNAAYVRLYSLISGEEIYRFGGFDWFSRRTWQAYDSSPIISDDTIVYAGENGVLYTSKLNAVFDIEAGTVTVDPERLVKMRYEGSGYSRSDASGARWYGVESSVAAFRNYAFFTDNGGRLQCVDLNTMKIKYVVDVTDDTDASVVIEESYRDNTFYLYTGSGVKTANGGLGDGYGYSYQRKINGLTGEVVWEESWICSTGDETTSGGIVATPHVGKYQIFNLVIYSFSFAAQSNGTVATDAADGDADAEDTEETAQSVAVPVPDENGDYSVGGRIVALDKSTGTLVWSIEQQNDYWASPVVVYDEQGRGYLIQCDRGGYITMYDAQYGTELNSLDLGSRIDSTPAVFNNMLIVGTRGKGGSGDSPKIVCVKIS
jgi:hypothetical protein